MRSQITPPDPPVHFQQKAWKGYTIDELRYRQAINHLKMMVVSERLKNSADNARRHAGSFFGPTLLSRLLSRFSALEYSMIAFRTGRQIFQLYKKFKRR